MEVKINKLTIYIHFGSHAAMENFNDAAIALDKLSQELKLLHEEGVGCDDKTHPKCSGDINDINGKDTGWWNLEEEGFDDAIPGGHY